MSNLSNARARLENEWTLLRRHWEMTAALWNDPVRYRFEREFWQDYEPALHAALKEMDELARVIDQARREVK